MGYATRLLNMGEWELQSHLQQRQNATLRRLNALLDKGYQVRSVKDVPETIWLSFPKYREPDLMLYSDGMIATGSANISFDPENPTQIYNFGPDDDRTFDRFLQRIRPASRREAISDFLDRYIYPWMLIAMLYGFAILAVLAVKRAFGW